MCPLVDTCWILGQLSTGLRGNRLTREALTPYANHRRHAMLIYINYSTQSPSGILGVSQRKTEKSQQNKNKLLVFKLLSHHFSRENDEYIINNILYFLAVQPGNWTLIVQHLLRVEGCRSGTKSQIIHETKYNLDDLLKSMSDY